MGNGSNSAEYQIEKGKFYNIVIFVTSFTLFNAPIFVLSKRRNRDTITQNN